MKNWKPGLPDREWGPSQGMPVIVVGDIPLHRPPAELPGAPGGGRRSTPSPVNDPARKGGWLHFFQASGSFQEQRGGGERLRSYPGDALPPAPSHGMP